MEKPSDISPGEKLLDLIRGASNGPGGLRSPAPRPLSSRQERRTSLFSGLSRRLGREVAVGVELGEDAIRMVKVAARGGLGREVTCRIVPVPQQGPDAPELSLVLRLALKDFLGRDEADIWSMVAPESAETVFLTVPKTGRKQLSSAVYWTARKEMNFNESEVVFDYEVQGEVVEKGASRLAVLAYTVARTDYERLRTLFVQAGYPLTGLTLPSVACSNLFAAGWAGPGDKPQACLHLGEEACRLEIVDAGQLRQVRVLKGGLAGMAQSLVEAAKEKGVVSAAREPKHDEKGASPFFASDIPVVLESMAAPAAPEPVGLSAGQAWELLDALTRDDRSGREPPPVISPDQTAALLRPAWERLARQIEMSLKHFSVTLGNDQAARLCVCGPHGANSRLLGFLRDHLGLECQPLDPLSPESLSRAGAVTAHRPQAERLPYALALGLTGSSRERCNLLYTYREKEEQARVSGLNRLVVAGWLALAVVCLGIHAWQHVQAYGKREQLAALQRELNSFQPRVDAALLTSTQARVRAVVDNLRRFGQRTLAQAVAHDVCALTPENVWLFAVSFDLGNPSEQPKPPQADQAAQARPSLPVKERAGLNTLTLEGYVKGDSQLLESILSAYLVRLRASPLMADVSVSKRNLEISAEGEDVLRFTLACAVKR